MDIPSDFLEIIKDMLGDSFEKFLSAVDSDVNRGLRINTLKTEKDTLLQKLDYSVKPSAFCSDSFYIPSNVQSPGNDPLHHAGAFYIQEPSASSAVEAMGIKPGDIVLDLCAAPGGKSTQIAALLAGKGLLWSNEYVKSRVQPLISNIERMGVSNAVVSNAHPDELASNLPCFFDKILVDAPCSGEGMFRKEPNALINWSIENSRSCGARQLHILESAAKMLKEGGILCYSTCTFSYCENEQVIGEFVGSHPEFSIIPIEREFGENGIEKYAQGVKGVEHTRHIFPHNDGEGHFVALLKRDGECERTDRAAKSRSKIPAVFEEFYNSTFDSPKLCDINVSQIGDKVYITPDFADIPNVSIVRFGVLAGEIKGNRFEPSHALFACPKFLARQSVELTLDDTRTRAFLKGEEIACDESFKGYTAVKLEGIALSFGKATQGRLKNHYPKGLRLIK